MYRTLFAIAVILQFASCNINQSESQSTDINSDENSTLYIKSVEATGTDTSQMKINVSSVSSDYFEIGLEEAGNGSHYVAEKTIEQKMSMDNFKSSFFFIVNKKGEQMKFKTSTEFLNFMSARDYEMVDQAKKRYGIDYTFKKK